MHSRDTVTSDPNLPSADYQVLLHAISSCSSVAVKQLLNLDPKLVNVKGKSYNNIFLCQNDTLKTGRIKSCPASACPSFRLSVCHFFYVRSVTL